jgi:Fe-S cluster assembly scaffold protein SufB
MVGIELSFENEGAILTFSFVREVLQELPMGFAVEAQKLVAIGLEGSVG